jgi:lysyl-tRNA synthetase class 2
MTWQPSAPLEMLQARAQLLSSIRCFFAERQVLEVETPLLARTTASDIHIQSWRVINDLAGALPPPYLQRIGKETNPLETNPLETNHQETDCRKTQRLKIKYLQTSPEFAMKRLLCAGSGSIYQICKAFRVEQNSNCHNPEFTMLEWYRLNFSLADLMHEVQQLVGSVTNQTTIPRYTYREVFQQHLAIDPHLVPTDTLEKITRQHIELVGSEFQRNDFLQLLLSQVIEPAMTGSWFIYDYPESQAALAQIDVDEHGARVARRFELFCNGMEIANGYQELADPAEQKRRFETDLDYREKNQLDVYPLDERLLAALNTGLPACAGVALGVDRLLMLVTGAKQIDQVLNFTTDQA